MKNYTFILFLLLFRILPVSGQERAHSLEIAAGNVKRFFLHSDIAECRNIDVWLPDGYSPGKQYPVLYMHDGQNLFSVQKGSAGREWEVDENMDTLINQQKIREAIVVGIWNTGMKRHSEYFPQKALEYIPETQRESLLYWMPYGPLADDYLRFIVSELKPFIDNTFSTYTDRDNTFICGSSMGGLISLYALCEYPEIFGGAGCISTHWIGTFDNNREIPEGINTYLKTSLPAPGNHKIYFDHGTEGLDAHYPLHQIEVDKIMKEKTMIETVG